MWAPMLSTKIGLLFDIKHFCQLGRFRKVEHCILTKVIQLPFSFFTLPGAQLQVIELLSNDPPAKAGGRIPFVHMNSSLSFVDDDAVYLQQYY